MPITNTTPIVKPASPEKIFDSLWIRRLTISSPSPEKIAFADIDVCAYNAEDGSILPSESKRIFIKDVFGKAETNPAIANAIQALIEAVDSIVQAE